MELNFVGVSTFMWVPAESHLLRVRSAPRSKNSVPVD
jgi:hypothetical protein